MSNRELALRTMLRFLVALVTTLSATAFVFGFFPGIEVYQQDAFVETRAVIVQWNWFLGVLVLLLAPGAVVWWHPRIGYALLWSLWTIALTTVVFVGTFDLGDWGLRTVALWPHAVFGFVMFAVLFLVIAIIPVACGAFWWITRERPVRPQLPIARVLKFRA